MYAENISDFKEAYICKYASLPYRQLFKKNHFCLFLQPCPIGTELAETMLTNGKLVGRRENRQTFLSFPLLVTRIELIKPRVNYLNNILYYNGHHLGF